MSGYWSKFRSTPDPVGRKVKFDKFSKTFVLS